MQHFNRFIIKQAHLRFDSIVSFKKAKELLLYATGITVFAALLLLVVPGLAEASGRLLNFNTEFVPPAKFFFEVQPENVLVTKGDDVFISVKVNRRKTG